MLKVFVNNVGAEKLTVQQAYELYKIRWQIELMFKTWKSF
ncbi:MAG: transposase [Ferruginibacter sp.]|nr:transposase [Ferruginibacter sp.]